MTSVDLNLLKKALISVAVAAILLCAFFLVGAVAILWRDHDRPQYLYEVTIAASGAIYFGALFTHSWRGVRQEVQEDKVAEIVRVLSQSVLGMFVPVALVAAFLIWLAFQPAY